MSIYDDVAMEDALFPWLASDCMADEIMELDYDCEEESELEEDE